MNKNEQPERYKLGLTITKLAGGLGSDLVSGRLTVEEGTNLRDMLQAVKQKRLSGWTVKTEIAAILDKLVTKVTEFDRKQQKLMREMGVLHVGEAFMLSDEHSSQLQAIKKVLRKKYPDITEQDIEYWEPCYWGSGFLNELSQPFAARASLFEAFYRHGQEERYTLGEVLRHEHQTNTVGGQRANPRGKGHLTRLQKALKGDGATGTNLWAGCKIPKDWEPTNKGIGLDAWMTATKPERDHKNAVRKALENGTLPDDLRNVLNSHVESLELSVHSSCVLQNMGIQFIWDLCSRNGNEILQAKKGNKKVLSEIKEALEGLNLGFDLPFIGPPN